MRIVAVADTHTFEADFQSIPDGDVFVHAGDMLRAGELVELEGVAAWIRSLPHRTKLIVAGNHDWCFAREREAALKLIGDAIYLEDSGVTVDGVRFWGSPWQPAYHNWAFNLPRGEELARKWAAIPQDTHVLVTHGPPRGIGDRGPVAGRGGCADLMVRVQAVRPALHLFGHIHQDGGVFHHPPTWFANVTTWESERAPTVLDFDPTTKQVVPVSVPPRATPNPASA
ncbi:MAG: metallophosphatase domain-containing protein [Myxococcota bacterium]